MYQAGVMMFSHVHYINGVMVVHSHPSKDSHTHTEGQVLTIAHVASFYSTEPNQLCLNDVFLPFLSDIIFQQLPQSIQVGNNRLYLLRAPPVSCLYL